jgi:hypothetical protein
MHQPPPLPPPLPRPRREGVPCLVVFLSIVGLLGVLVALAFVSLSTANRRANARADEAEERLSAEWGIPRDADAWAALYPPVDDKNNAAPHYLKALHAMDYLEEGELRDRLDASYPDFRYTPEPIDEEAVNEFLERNVDAMAHIRRAVRKPECRFSIDFEDGHIADDGLFDDMTSLCWLLTFQTVRAAELGKARAAKTAIAQSLVIMRHMAGAPLLEAQEHAAWSMQYAADAWAFAAGRRLFNDAQLAQLSTLFAEAAAAISPHRAYVASAAGINVTLGRLRAGELGLVEVMGEEWAYDQALTSGRNPLLSAIYANSHRITLEGHAELIEGAGLPPRAQIERIAAFERKLRAMDSQMHFAAILLDSLPDRAHEFILEFVTHQLVQAAIAVERHRLATGSLPENLDALEAREYLDDPMGDGLLQYRREDQGYLLYSVAANGTDDAAPKLDGGWESQWYNGDWFFRVGAGDSE